MSTEQQQVNEQNTLPADGMDFLGEKAVGSVAAQNNTGVLYANTQRRKESHPNCRGRALVGGKWYWLSGWNNINSQDNARFVSLAYTEMTQEDVDKYVNKVEATQEDAANKALDEAVKNLEEDTKAQTGQKPKEDEIF